MKTVDPSLEVYIFRVASLQVTYFGFLQQSKDMQVNSVPVCISPRSSPHI